MQTVRKYQEVNITTASPMELIVMLYDDCIRSLEKAEKAFDMEGPERIETINNTLLHAQDIITELAVSLDMEKGGQIAQNLQKLYDFMVNHLSHANINKVVKPVSDVKKMMNELREAWKEVATKESPREELPVSSVSSIHISG
ncbi:MAG TPA: flagellar export chaperone FliS [Verrucomicrobia bacterium]|nr:MAG: flagellar export chaperone FliS [Lentisphaerae bacterium GWF2_57_35]HBA83830.1 flagellar export chaperone FliS [Verrucomicrobiota bacterium]